MKITILVPITSGRGGIETVLSNLSRELHAAGDDVRVLMYSGSNEKEWLKHIPWVTEIGSPKQLRPVRLWTYFKRTIEELRRRKPDAIVCLHPKTLRIARLCRSLLRLRKTPIVLWLHGPLGSHAGIAKALATADGHICICQERADEVQEALSGFGSNSHPIVRIAYNGTSVGKLHTVARPEVPTFVYLGRLLYGEEKRLCDILAAAARVRGDFRILFVGDGPEEDKELLQQMAQQSGISDKLEWLGWQPDPWAVVDSATALVLTSSFEGFSMATAEALALGLPVICSEFGGIEPEVIYPGVTGWTFAIGDVAALAAIMQALIDQTLPMPDSGDIKKIGAKFSAEAMAASFRSALVEMQNKRAAMD